MTESQFLTRRQLRELERNGLNPENSSSSQQALEDIEDPKIESTIEIQETVTAAAFFDDDFIPNIQPPIVERPAVKWLSGSHNRIAAPRVQAVEGSATAPAEPIDAEVEEERDLTTSDFFTQGLEVVEPLFDVSPNLILEPTTNSIVIENFGSIDNFTGTITETGEILKTGSIELPLLLSNTGELEIIAAAESLDAAIAAESSSGFVSTIAPVRATGIVNSASRFKILPANLKKGQGQVYLVLTAAILMVTVGGLTIAGFMLGIL